jgi:hypothetical protein
MKLIATFVVVVYQLPDVGFGERFKVKLKSGGENHEAILDRKNVARIIEPIIECEEETKSHL